MARCTLKFWNLSNPELTETYFEHSSDRPPLRCIRGRGLGAHQGCGTFQWTPAVKALTILLLQSKISKVTNSPLEALQGGAGTLATSLEFCLRKLPSWTVEMFGRDRSGRPTIRRIVQRSNIGLRYAGPVALTVNSNFLNELEIEVILDSKKITESFEFLALSEAIKDNWRPHRVPVGTKPSPELRVEDGGAKSELLALLGIEKLRSLRESIIRESIFSFQNTDIFSRQGLGTELANIFKSPAAKQLWHEGFDIERCFSKELEIAGDLKALGTLDSESLREKPIHVFIPTVPGATTALLRYIKQVRSIPLEVVSSFAYAGQALDNVEKLASSAAPPELLSFNTAYTALAEKRLKRLDYEPFFVLPRGRSRIVARRSKERGLLERLSTGKVLMMCDGPSSASTYLDSLIKKGVVQKRSVQSEHSDPRQSFLKIKEGDPDDKAIVFFPHHFLNVLLNDCEYIDTPWIQDGSYNSMILAHRSFINDGRRAQALRLELRHAWLKLRDGGPELEQIVDFFLQDREYSDGLIKASGLDTSRISTDLQLAV